MFVPALQVIYASHILVQRKRLKLWNGDLQRVNDLAQTCDTSPLRRFGDLLDEIASVRIVRPADRPVRLAHELRDDVRITHGAQKIGHEPKLTICVDLLEKVWPNRAMSSSSSASGRLSRSWPCSRTISFLR